jgi:hypothetical protein
MDNKKKFWKKYKKEMDKEILEDILIKRDEFEQRIMLKKLTGTKENKDGFFEYMSLSLFKSYIDDALSEVSE